MTDRGSGSLADVHLVVFMTAGMSLAAWEELGMFEREVELYRRLRPHVGAITLVTYGGRGDRAFTARLSGIDIVCNRWRLPGAVFRWLVSRVHPRRWDGRVVVKSNQIRGADVALRAARAAGGAFIARCGYMLSEFTARSHGVEHSETVADKALEAFVFRGADRCVVTTEAMAETVAAYGVPREWIHVVPNYVDADRLAPGGAPPRTRVGFVGRLHDQKNLFALVDAMASIDAELYLVGDGPEGVALKARAAERSVRATFPGRLPHGELAAVINSCAVFALPSLYEGHPKALLEAMSCGAAVLGTDVPGIREVVRHGETGWLCGTDASEIADGLRILLSDPGLRARLGQGARAEILRTCSLDRVVELEREVLALAAGVPTSP